MKRGEDPEMMGRGVPASEDDPDPASSREERIAARRRRVAACIDAKRREALGEDVGPKVDEKPEENQRGSHKLIEESRKNLAKLLFHGTQMVTNVQVDTDFRETQRRAKEDELKLQRVEKLENEARSSIKKFEEITSKWALSEDLKIHQDLWQLLQQQQQQCEQLLEEKNKLISDLQEELRSKDEQYEEAIKKQSEDIYLLSERMEDQIRLMMKTYRRQLQQIEEEFQLKRRELLDNNRKNWEETFQAHIDQELENICARKRKVEEYEQQLRQLHMKDEQDYKQMKKQLENEVENLQKKLHHMKAVYKLDEEKLKHNIDMLKKQDEENTIIRSQQKRKINRLHSLLHALRAKLANQEKQFQEDNQSLTDDYESIMKHYREVQQRMRHFMTSDAEKFREVWLMNEKEAKGMIQKALDADRIIHTQQLGLPWKEPHYWFLDNVGPLDSSKEKKVVAKLAAEVLAGSSSGEQEEEGGVRMEEEASSGEGGKENPEMVEDRVTPLRNISRKTAKRILEVMSEELGFLAVNRGMKPLQVPDYHEHIFMRLNSIFEALRINSEDDLYQLMDFFLKYKAQEMSVDQSQGSPGGEDPAKDTGDNGSGAQQDELKAPCRILGSHPSVQIHADDVLKVLKEFMKDFDKLRKKGGSAQDYPQARDSSKDGEYWEALAHAIPKSTLKLWDALARALQKYHEVLASKVNLLAEAAALEQQNRELCRLLTLYSRSRSTPRCSPFPRGGWTSAGPALEE